jgi:hypothetical protein
MHTSYPSSTHIGSSPTPVSVVPPYAIVLYLQLCLYVGQNNTKRWSAVLQLAYKCSSVLTFQWITLEACWSAHKEQVRILDSGCWSRIWRIRRTRSARRRAWRITHDYRRRLMVVRCTLPADVRFGVGANDVARDNSHFESSGDVRLVEHSSIGKYSKAIRKVCFR